MISGDGDIVDAIYPKQSEKSHVDIIRNSPSNSNDGSRLPPSKAALRPKGHDRSSHLPKVYAQNIMGTSQSYVVSSDTRMEVPSNQIQRFENSGQSQPHKDRGNFTMDVEDLDIPWSDLVLKERIGAGKNPQISEIRSQYFGSVYGFNPNICFLNIKVPII